MKVLQTSTTQGPRRLRFRGRTRRNSKGGRHRLDLRVVVEDELTHFTSPTRLLVAAEGQRGVEDIVAVDPDRSGTDPLGDLVRLGDVSAPYAGGEAVGRAV